MPAKIKVTKEDIIRAAVETVRSDTDAALSARSIATSLKCSTQPIFSNFSDMTELRTAVISRVWEIYNRRIEADMARGRYPAFKAGGMSYITFAVEEPNLFKLLFMRDRIADGDVDRNPDVENIISVVMSATGMNKDEAKRFHDEMWIFVHGLAVMFATGFSTYCEEKVSAMLSEVYFALLNQYKNNSAAPQ